MSANPLPQLGSDSAIAKPNQLCQLCRSIFDVDTRFVDTGESPHGPPESWIHHHHGNELVDSASAGCHLCSVILYALQRRENIQFKDEVGRMAPSSGFGQRIGLGIKTPSEGNGSIAIIAPPSESSPFANATSYIHYSHTFDLQYNQNVDTITHSKRTVSLLKDWFEDCRTKHEFCRNDTQKKAKERDDYSLPTRLLYIKGQHGSLSVNLTGTESLSSATEYVALSYRWSTQQGVRLTKSTEASFGRQIDVSSLPKSILHAIVMANGLGYEYLWIDALCIIQDSELDWLQESARMCDYYSYSTLTISANTTDPDSGFLTVRNPLEKMPCFVIPKGRAPPIYIRQPSAMASGEIDPLKQLPLARRGWVFQERLLAPRIMHFTDNEVFWECSSALLSDIYPNHPWDPARKRWLAHAGAVIDQTEAQDDFLPGLGTFGFLMQRGRAPGLMDVTIWTELIEEYSALNLSFERDKLAAIGGLARKAYKVTSGELGRYFAGMWEKALPLQLGWMTFPYFPDVFINPRTETYKAPSWSWASVNCRVMYPRQDKISDERMFTLLDVHFEHALDEYGPLKNCWLRLRGSLLPIKLTRPRKYNDPAHPEAYPKIHYQFGNFSHESFDSQVQMDGNPVTEIPQPEGTTVFAFPIALYTHNMMDTVFYSLNALLLKPTGRKDGQYSRVGVMKLHMEPTEDFMRTYDGPRSKLPSGLFQGYQVDRPAEGLLPQEYSIEII